MSEGKQCILYSLHNDNHILLENCKVVSLGRSPITYITDGRCSRNQVSVTALYETNKVVVRHTGWFTSTANGTELDQTTHVLNDGEILEMLSGKYPYRVRFRHAANSSTYNNSEKRALSNSNDVVSEAKKQMTEQNNMLYMENEKYMLVEEKCNHIDEVIDLCKIDEALEAKKQKTEENEDTNKKRVVIKDIKYMLNDETSIHTTEVIDICEKDVWNDIDSGKLLIYTSFGVQSRSKIAAYDMDGTLIVTKSGRVFPKDKDDWRIAFPSVKQKLQSLISDGYKIVIFTNQAGIGTGKTKPDELKYKIERIVKELGVPVQVFVATSNSIYRKPAPGMWRALTENKNSVVAVNIKKSFYVGDGAGRVANWAPKKKKDFSCSDRLFALNLGLKFETPEEHFLRQPAAEYMLPEFNPFELVENLPISNSTLTKRTKEVILMVGYPGSGKSTFVQKHLVPEGYAYVNRDSIGSWQRCVAVMEIALRNNQSVVIDNTNPDRASRSRFINKARSLNTPCRCFVMSTTYEHSKHNNKFREFTDKTHAPVNDIVMNSYKSKLQYPSVDEGFEEVVNINFVPQFEDEESMKLYKMYLI